MHFISVESHRGAIVESISRVAGIALASDGRVIEQHAPDGFRVSPRSSVKPFQALPYVMSGAFAAEGARLERLALACASHQGESQHLQVLREWLLEVGLTELDLRCGAHLPDHLPSAEELIRSGLAASKLHNNCSGKHLAMLSTARFLGEPVDGYADASSLAQQRVREALDAFIGEAALNCASGVDGCSLPTYECGLESLARAWLRLLAPPSAYQTAAETVIRAMQTHPDLVEGTGSLTSEVIKRSKGDVLIKVGAAGVYAGVVISRRLAFAFKCWDGQFLPVEEVVLDFFLRQRVFSKDAIAALYQEVVGEPKNWAGQIVGERRVRLSHSL